MNPGGRAVRRQVNAMNDAWMAVVFAFVVTLAVMAAVGHFLLHLNAATTVGFSLVWAVVNAGGTAWRERR